MQLFVCPLTIYPHWLNVRSVGERAVTEAELLLAKLVLSTGLLLGVPKIKRTWRLRESPDTTSKIPTCVVQAIACNSEFFAISSTLAVYAYRREDYGLVNIIAKE